MKRTIYLLAITVITIAAVIVGTGIHAGGFGLFRINGNSIGSIEDTIVLDDFDSIEFDTDVADISIKEGTDYKIHYRCTKNMIPEWQVADKKLKVINKKKEILFGVNNNCRIEITVPRGSELTLVNIQNDVGDVEIDGILTKECNVESNVGDIDLNNVTMENSVMNSDTGDIEIKKSTFTDLDLSSDVGSITVESSQRLTDYAFDLSTDVGEIEFNNEEYGKKYRRDGDAGKITIQGDVGDIEIKD